MAGAGNEKSEEFRHLWTLADGRLCLCKAGVIGSNPIRSTTVADSRRSRAPESRQARNSEVQAYEMEAESRFLGSAFPVMGIGEQEIGSLRPGVPSPGAQGAQPGAAAVFTGSQPGV